MLLFFWKAGHQSNQKIYIDFSPIERKEFRAMKKYIKSIGFIMVLAFILMLAGICTRSLPVVQSKASQIIQEAAAGAANGLKPDTNTGTDTTSTVEPESTDSPNTTDEPVGTPKPSATPNETSTPKPSAAPQETDTPEPSVTPYETVSPEPSASPTEAPIRLKQVSGVALTRYSTHSIKVSWEKHKKAKFYRVYYSKKKNGNGHLAGITRNTQYRVKNLKNNTKYYFYVVACEKRKTSDSDSRPSKMVHMETRKYVRKIIIAGDSITKGITDYSMLNRFSINGKKEVVAAVGLNTITFRTRRAFGGMTGLQKIIAEKPSRVYMMLGINEVHYRRVNDMLSDYESMIQAIKRSSPDTDIVLCAISPVTKAERLRNKGFWQLPVFNKKLKKLAKKTNTKYFDYTDFLKDSGGYLKVQYAERDGYHWIPSVYPKFAAIISKYDKSLDG